MRRIVSALAGALLVAACAAESSKRPAESPASKTPAADFSAPAGGAGAPAQTQPAAPPPAPEPAQPGYAQPPGGRAAALSRAGGDFDVAQRELEVAAGDCRNACRALGSMDRAAGHLCTLASTTEEGRRCDDAKKRVYTARDRVRSTCGICPEGPTVDRNAPVPSR
jgi:hypothetical protein